VLLARVKSFEQRDGLNQRAKRINDNALSMGFIKGF
jgi:hypothetical protein